jgi:hypothetical protein
MNHLQVWEAEKASENNTGDRAWHLFCSEVEKLTKLDSLDGDQEKDGYSLDEAYDWFSRKFTAEDYANHLNTPFDKRNSYFLNQGRDCPNFD